MHYSEPLHNIRDGKVVNPGRATISVTGCVLSHDAVTGTARNTGDDITKNTEMLSKSIPSGIITELGTSQTLLIMSKC